MSAAPPSASASASAAAAPLPLQTVWHEFTPAFCAQSQAINLGQGFPNWDPPAFVVDALVSSVNTKGPSVNQYCRPEAHLPLAKALAYDYNAKWHDLNPSIPSVDPLTNVVTAIGCTQAMSLAVSSLLDRNADHEAILLEPAFDIYAEQVKLAGGRCRFVPLKTVLPGSDANAVFQLDWSALEAALGPKTRLLILNTPHNPTGKMFSREEQLRLAALLEKWPDVVVIADEVYEHITYDDVSSPHVSFASLSPSTFARTLTLSSAGKTFTTTGWKVGWAVGPARLIKPMTALQQWVTFSCPSVTQDAIAAALVKAREPQGPHPSFYAALKTSYKAKRSLLAEALTSAGLTPILPAGGFFICCDTSSCDVPEATYSEESVASPRPMPRDWALARHLVQRGPKVAAIPPSAFYCEENKHLAKDYLRFAFCKTDDMLVEAGKRLREWKATSTTDAGDKA